MKNFKINFNQKLGEKNIYEHDYWNLIESMINTGELRNIRGADVYTLFGLTLMNIDISNVGKNKYKFPLFTSRKVAFKFPIEEILWILRGDVDTLTLEKRGINIWKGNTRLDFLKKRGVENYVEEGFLGPMYGFQIRHFGADFKKINAETMAEIKSLKSGYDQLENIVKAINFNKMTRTLLMTTFNPAQVQKGCLYPCTGIVIQFFVDKQNRLHQIMYQRSADFLIGVVHNVAMYSVLNYIVAQLCNLESGTLKVFFGDSHVYKNHIPLLTEVSDRGIEIFETPMLQVPDIKSINCLNSLTYEDFTLFNYPQDIKPVIFPMFV